MKPQDIVIAFKLISKSAKSENWTQNQIALELCMSPSEVNAGLKRLQESGLLTRSSLLLPPKIKSTLLCKFLLHGIRYVFPVKLGALTRGIATSYAAPIFKNKIAIGNDPVPVWPFAEGNARGLAVTPLYKSVPHSIAKYPDQLFYDMLSLVDAIRCGMARERNIAADLLTKILRDNK
jgi:DNA-binding Lrp family transcriptional regulator